ncbi:MAG: cellulase family glycosylhydrolase [Oscillospiraceae bacterium]
MKRRIKAIIAALLCASLLCGCAGDPQENGSAYSSGTTAESTVSPDNSSADGSGSPTESTENTGNNAVNSDNNAENNSTTANGTDNTTASNNSTTASTDSAGTPDLTPEKTTATTTAATAAQPAENNDPQEASGFALEWKQSSTWEENGKKCGGYEVTLVNNTGSAVNGWTAEISVPGGFEIISSWNGIFSVNGSTLTVKNESYNGEIAAGAGTGFGFNYAADSVFNPGNASVNGSTASSGTGSQGGGDNSTASTTATTKATTVQTAPPAPADPDGTTPVAAHGQLSVKGAQLVDKNGNAYQLRGMSTHGLTWFPDFVNENAFRTLRDDWNTNVVRLAMYVDEWGNGQCYMQNKDGSRKLLEKGVDICIGLGMYVIIDWHVLNPGDPSKYTDEAISFFEDISAKYADYPNIIYEICNEPNSGAEWSSCIKPYAEKVIPAIRKNDKDAVIIVGTPTWSQDIDRALNDPLDCDNVMYALHFYAATHTDWLRDRLENCVNNGLPVFVSEFGCCDASGGGANDFGQAEKWLTLLDKHGISYCNWSLANKAETCSAFKPSASAGGSWSESDLSEVGAWIRKWFRNH